MFSLIHTWINGWVNNSEAGALRRRRGHYDVTVMLNIDGAMSGIMYYLIDKIVMLHNVYWGYIGLKLSKHMRIF